MSATEGKVFAELKVEEEHTNYAGNIHSSFVVLLLDVITSISESTNPKKASVGASIDIQVHYLGTAKVGDEISIEANVVGDQKELAFLDCVIRNKSKDNSIVAKGKQCKYTGGIYQGYGNKMESIVRNKDNQR